jgi:hypothetical protein
MDLLHTAPDGHFAGFGPATCLPSACFCEFVHVAGIRQPANTWSSLCFVAVGSWILWSKPNGMPSPLRLAQGVVAIALGLSSAAFHATLTFGAQWLDNLTMYAYAALLGAINAGILRALTPRRQLLLAFGVTVASSALAWWVPALRRYVFDALLLWALASFFCAARGTWRGVARRPLQLAVSALVVALLAWILDNSHVLCLPHSTLQGHALWHSLCALATAFVFEYIRRGFARGIRDA